MRFVHLADVHLDTPFSSRSPRVRARLREATRQAFRSAVDLALEREVDAFLIAGDLFDGDRLSFQTESFLVDELDRLARAGVRVVYVTGNHDPGAPGQPALRVAWPEGVTVVADPAPTRIGIRGRDGRPVGFVTAAGHASAHETGNLAGRFPRPEGSLPEVAVLHTQVVGSLDEGAHQPYAPSTLEGLRASGFHYWALGHVHLRQALSHDPPVHYPGSVQGRTPREDGPRGGLVVDLSDPGAPGVEFHRLGPVLWRRLTVDGLAECANLDQLLAHLVQAWTQEAPDRDGDAPAEDDTLLHLTLTGPCPLWRLLAEDEERDALSERLAARLGLLWVDTFADQVHPVVHVRDHLDRNDVLGQTLRLLQELAEGGAQLPELDRGELAAFYLWDPGDVDTYLRGLLPGSGEEVLARMLVQGGAGDR